MELQETLRLHKLYLEGAEDGVMANLQGADLQGADLRWANLQWADLRGANLYVADLTDTKLSDFQICPQGGAFVAYKKIRTGVIKLMIPEHAQRTSTLVGRKCRASSVIVLEGPEGYDRHTGKTFYKVWEEVFPDHYDGDIRVECTNGIHFFMTKQEAGNY